MRYLARLRAFGFIAQFVVLDVALRGMSCLGHPWASLVHQGQSLLLWSVVWALRGRRGARVVAALAAASILAVQLTFRRYYHGNIDAQVLRSAVMCWSDVWPVVVRALPQALWIAVPVAIVQYLMLAPSGGNAGRLPLISAGVLVLSVALAGPVGQGPPDLQLIEALRILWQKPVQTHVARVEVPPLISSRPRLPNILLVISESVRASDFCSAPVGDCPVAPASRPAELDRPASAFADREGMS